MDMLTLSRRNKWSQRTFTNLSIVELNYVDKTLKMEKDSLPIFVVCLEPIPLSNISNKHKKLPGKILYFHVCLANYLYNLLSLIINVSVSLFLSQIHPLNPNSLNP